MNAPAAVLTDHTILEWVAPSLQRLRLSGAKDVTELGVWLDLEGVDGGGYIDEKALFDAAARQWGETYVGTTLDHAELDVPLFVLGADPDDFRRRVEHLRTLVRRDRPGWLMAYTNATGWRWFACRLGHLKSIEKIEPRITSAAHFEMVLLVEVPIPRCADDTDEWVNTAGSGMGALALYPGPHRMTWPQFTLRGPGTFRIRYGANDVPFPPLVAGETVLVNTDEARPIIRSSLRRNLFPLMKGRKFVAPIQPNEVAQIRVSVTGGSAASAVYATCGWQAESLL